MKALTSIIIEAIAAHFTGSVVLFGFLSGISGALFSPILSLFGCFLIFPEIAGACAQWKFYSPQGRKVSIRFFLVSGVIASFVAAVFGPKEEGKMIDWAVGYALAAACAAISSGLIIHYAKVLSAHEKQG